MPGARIYRPIYYQWNKGAKYETDGILIYEDHLFVIEVKGGAFTYTSPANDLSGYIKSLKNLVENPISQGNRFVEYLEIQNEVSLCDDNGEEIIRLRHSCFRNVTVCAITLDEFTEIAARNPQRLNIDQAQRPAWVISIDDLRVYADLFDNPLVFLHCIEERMRAAHSPLIDLDDEYEHLGLYIVKNNYCQYAKHLIESEPNAKLFLAGFKKPSVWNRSRHYSPLDSTVRLCDCPGDVPMQPYSNPGFAEIIE